MSTDVDPLSEALFRSFAVISKGLRLWVRSVMAAEPIMTVGRAGVLLGLLERSEPVSMSALGTAQDLTPRSMTVLVDGLDREGLVQRTTDPQDRRVSLLSLTPAGRVIATEQLRPARIAAAALFDELAERDRQELLRLLGEVATRLAEHGIDLPSRPGR